jgi:hypothetical protein
MIENSSMAIHTPSKALFPISIDSELFTTDRATKALSLIGDIYDEIFFIIADTIPLYNKAMSIKSPADFSQTTKEFQTTKQVYRTDKSRWIKKITSKIFKDHSKPICTILDTNDLYDKHFFDIYRNIVIMYSTSNQFRNDVVISVNEHFYGKNTAPIQHKRLKLSTAYILEEIALNIRARTFLKIESEYYLGSLPKPLLGLYNNYYGISIYDLTNAEKININFSFYTFRDETDIPYWKKT